jgi:hypothetical protein
VAKWLRRRGEGGGTSLEGGGVQQPAPARYRWRRATAIRDHTGGVVWLGQERGDVWALFQGSMLVGLGQPRRNSGMFNLFKHFQIDLNQLDQMKVLPNLKIFK